MIIPFFSKLCSYKSQVKLTGVFSWNLHMLKRRKRRKARSSLCSETQLKQKARGQMIWRLALPCLSVLQDIFALTSLSQVLSLEISSPGMLQIISLLMRLSLSVIKYLDFSYSSITIKLAHDIGFREFFSNHDL